MSTWGGGSWRKEPCPNCGRLIHPVGMRDHRIAKHAAKLRRKRVYKTRPYRVRPVIVALPTADELLQSLHAYKLAKKPTC